MCVARIPLPYWHSYKESIYCIICSSLSPHLVLSPGGLFPLHQSQWLCQRLVLAEDKTSVSEAIILNLAESVTVTIKAKVFVLAAGAIHTPQIMFNSGLRPRALGHYLCDHPMANCQVVLSPSILQEVRERYPEAVAWHAKEHPDDPVPIPLDDPPPQVRNCMWVLRTIQSRMLDPPHHKTPLAMG